MSAHSPSSYGIYFVDILACVLFTVTLSLVSAHFGRETQVPIALPELAQAGPAPAGVPPVPITVREEDGVTHLYWQGDAVSVEELRQRLAREHPPAVEVRMEASPLTRVLAAVHTAGVEDVRVAYRSSGEQTP